MSKLIPAAEGIEVWRSRFQLPDLRRASVLRAARERPFSDPKELTSLVLRFFRAVPRSSGEQPDIVSAAGWILLQAWQSGSHFPAFAENYAEVLLQAEERGEVTEFHRWIIEVITGPLGSRCGHNELVLADPDLIRESERHLHGGSFDGFLRAKVKHAEIEARVAVSPEFKRDWRRLSRLYPDQVKSRRILHRSLAPERNWVRDGGARFGSPEDQFQSALDLLCWKYGLWAVARGKPLVLKPSVTVTPWGTQIFIPAWQSFDAKRDFDWAYIARLHRARGIPRQGPKLIEGRRWRHTRAQASYAANGEAKRTGLRGEARLDFVRQRVGIPAGVDDREVRRLIAAGRTGAKQ